MMNPITFGLAVAATASLGFANGDGPGKDGDKLLDNLFQDGVKVSYKPGSGVTFEGDKGDFKLNVAGRIQAKWYYTMLDGGNGGNDSSLSSFEARRARTKFSGHVFNEDITYYLQLEHTSSPNVLDAIVGWRFVNNEDSAVMLSVGVMKTRGGLQSDNSSSALEFVERSAATRTFADERGTGALLWGGMMNSDNGHRLFWHVGAFNNDNASGNTTSAAAANADSEFMYTIGLLFAGEGLKGGPNTHVEGDLEHNGKFEPVIGANIAAGTAPDSTGATNSVQTINVYASLKTGAGIAAQGEVWVRTDEQRSPGNPDADSMGWYAQASYTMPPGEGTQWGFAGRVAMVTLDDGNAALRPRPSLEGTDVFGYGTTGSTGAQESGEILEGTLGVNAYYHKHKLKTQINYVYQDIQVDDGGPDLTNHGLDIMFSLFF